jgi:hypothetical protein
MRAAPASRIHRPDSSRPMALRSNARRTVPTPTLILAAIWHKFWPNPRMVQTASRPDTDRGRPPDQVSATAWWRQHYQWARSRSSQRDLRSMRLVPTWIWICRPLRKSHLGRTSWRDSYLSRGCRYTLSRSGPRETSRDNAAKTALAAAAPAGLSLSRRR